MFQAPSQEHTVRLQRVIALFMLTDCCPVFSIHRRNFALNFTIAYSGICYRIVTKKGMLGKVVRGGKSDSF